jgi:hypothetical protein
MKKIKKLRILILLFLTGTLLAGMNPLGFEGASSKNNNLQDFSAIKDSKVILESLVILENSDTQMNLSGFNKVGGFYFQVNPTAESIKKRKLEISNNANFDVEIKTYKLVEAPGNRYMITDGSFIIGFKDESDRKRFAEDFNLTAKSNFKNKTAFLTKGFSNFENLVDDIKADSRVLSFELDLINPNLRTR